MDYTLNICSLAVRIEENIKKDIDYEELGKAVGYSYNHIRRFLKQIANVSLSRYILARKIAHTAFEIRHSKKSITDIALEYGFSNIDTFTRAFQRNTGMTPSQFKSSEYLCGRRIICPGVYAPVILNHDNPEFTLQHIKEVNEMAEIKKTNDGCILYGVPKVHFGREVDGEHQSSPFPMCLQAVLNYMGQNISYTEIMAACGAAFRLRWDIGGGFTPWAIDVTQIYYKPQEVFERAFKAAGRKYKILGEGDNDKKDYLGLIKSELDCGRPVIALGVVGPPEACVVTGYRNNGETLLGWSVFQDGNGCEIDESGYFIKEGWLENTQTVMAIAEETSTQMLVSEVLKNGLALMTQDEVSYSWSEVPGNYGGQAAYEAWAKAFESDNFDESGANGCQGDAECMAGDDRRCAAAYMGLLAEQYPKLAAEFKECARLLNAVAGCTRPMKALREEHGWSNEVRKQIAELIRKAAKNEKEACVILQDIIDKI